MWVVSQAWGLDGLILARNFFFVNNLTIKHCDKTKVKTITVKNSQKTVKILKRGDDVSTFTQRDFQVKMNKKTLFWIQNKSLET